MHHERVWRLWFESAAGLIPAWEAQVGEQGRPQRAGGGLRGIWGNRCRHAHSSRARDALPPLLPLAAPILQAAVCKSSASKYRALVKACAGEQASEAASEVVKGQHLFSVYVHAPPLFKGYPEDSLWAPHLIDRRVATVCVAAPPAPPHPFCSTCCRCQLPLAASRSLPPPAAPYHPWRRLCAPPRTLPQLGRDFAGRGHPPPHVEGL